MTDRLKTVYPPKATFCGGYNYLQNEVKNVLDARIDRVTLACEADMLPTELLRPVVNIRDF